VQERDQEVRFSLEPNHDLITQGRHNHHTPAISLQHVDKTLGGKKVLDDLSFDIGRGESYVIVGGSGVARA